MKYLLCTICLVILSISCGKKQVSVQGGLDLNGYTQKEVKGSNASWVSKVDAEGKILEEGMIRDGLQNGTWVTYHPEEVNKIKTITNFVNGAMNGLYLEMNNRGQIEKRATFINNQNHGLYAEYKFGRPLKEYIYNEGILDGIAKEYSDRGNLTKESPYKDGKLHGSFKQYDEEGNVIIEYEYKNGEKVRGGIVTK